MIEFNTEYNYKDICNALGWHISSGNKRQNQIRLVEESFEYYHPINPKTKKPKKSYIFTKQIKDIRDTKRDIFINLYNYTVNVPHYQISIGNGYFLVDTIQIYNAFFGIDLSDIIQHLRADNPILLLDDKIDTLSEKEYKNQVLIINLFIGDMINIVRNLTISKICRYEDVGKATLPKSIVRDKKRGKGLIEDYDLLDIYMQYEQDFMAQKHCKGLVDVYFRGKMQLLNDYVQEQFIRCHHVNGIKKVNRVPKNHKNYKYDKSKIPNQQREYRLLLLDALTKKAYNRTVAKPNSYSFVLHTDKQKDTYNHALMRLYEIFNEPYRECAEEIAYNDFVQLIEDDDCDLSDYLD